MISAEGLLYAVLSFGRQSGPTPWETCAALLPATSGQITIAVTPSGSYVVQRLGDNLDRDTLYVHTPRELPVGQHGSFVLGSKDRDQQGSDAVPWPPVPGVPRHRVRRVDTLYASSHDVGLIILDCPSSAADVLLGAERVLREHRPAVLLDLSSVGVAHRLALWERCRALLEPTYTWYDGMLLHCTDAQRGAEAILTLASRTMCALPAERAVNVGQNVPDVILSTDLASIATLAWGGWRSPILKDQAGNRTSVGFDPDLPSENLYPAETDGGAWWRWTGPNPRSSFAMPIAGPGRWSVTFDIINSGNITATTDIRVFADRQRLALKSLDSAKMAFGPLTIDAARAANVIRIQVVTPPTRRASQDDPRRIGISISRCTLEPA